MKDKHQHQNGYSLIELTIAMMLLVMFGLGVFMLAASSTTTYEKLVDEKSTSEELRIASSYLVTKLRQNDRAESISIDTLTLKPEHALTIKEPIGEETYVTWIFVHEGVLREATLLEGVLPTVDLSFEIAKIDGMTLNSQNNSMFISLEKGEKISPEIQVTLKTELGLNE